MQNEDFWSWQPVAALALFDGQDRLLLQQRPAGKRHGGLWEFPGGKVEAGETPREALAREIAEELAIVLDIADLAPAYLAEEDADRPIVLLLYTARRWSGTIMPAEEQAWGWFDTADATRLDLAPMDRRLLERIAR